MPALIDTCIDLHQQVTKVSARGKDSRNNMKQLLSSEPLNQRDPFLLSAPADGRELLIAKELPPPPELARDLERDARLEVFDIVLLRG